ncbi:MAG: hypothetical protein JKY08_07630 [Flavobacteriaceae bacterium]|nr:hypothetical protein [Flavobacteriaceae bacterium]
MKNILVFFLLVLSSTICIAQIGGYQPVFWKLSSFSGNAHLRGSYAYSDSNLDKIKSSNISPGLSIYTNSYFYHPNLISLSINASYTPDIQDSESLISPSYRATNTNKSLFVRVHLLKKKMYNGNISFKYIENYANRENYTKIKSENSLLWANFNYFNKVVPIQIDLKDSNIEITEILYDRTIRREETSVQIKSSKRYGVENEVKFNYFREQTFNSSSSSYNRKNETVFNINNLYLNNVYHFNKKNKGLLNTSLSYNSLANKIRNQSRFRLYNRASYDLPYRFNVLLIQDFSTNKSNNTLQTSNNISTVLYSKVYESLFSNASINYHDQKSNFFTKGRTSWKLNVNYRKKTPFKSTLLLDYTYQGTKTKKESATTQYPVFNEKLILSDLSISYLNASHISINTIVVKNIQGDITYELNLDYILIEIGNFTEVKRVPGGLITDGSTLTVDYISMQPGDYTLDATLNSYRIALHLYKNIVQVYYSTSAMSYSQALTIDYLTLDNYEQERYGAKLNLGFLIGGVQYENKESSLFPYSSLTYHLSTHGTILNRISYSINFDMMQYDTYGNVNQSQVYYNASSNLSFSSNYKDRINIRSGYRNQLINNESIEWITAVAEYETNFRQVKVKIIANYYSKTYLDQNQQYLGGSIQLSRSF